MEDIIEYKLCTKPVDIGSRISALPTLTRIDVDGRGHVLGVTAGNRPPHHTRRLRQSKQEQWKI